MPIEMVNDKFPQIFMALQEKLNGHIIFGEQPFCMNYMDHIFTIAIDKKTPRTKISDDNLHQIQITHYNESEIHIGHNSELIITETADIPLISWNLKKRGIGGLKDATQEIFRRAFSSRQNPQGAVHVGTDHVRGVLLHGPPGCGKTLIAR